MERHRNLPDNYWNLELLKARVAWKSFLNSRKITVWIELPHDKTNKMACAPSEDSDQPGHLPSLIRVFAVRMMKLGPLPTYWAHTKDFDQTGQIPRLIWVFAARTVVLLVLTWGGSIVIDKKVIQSCFMIWTGYQYLSFVTRKPVFRVFDQVRLKLACAATEASYRIEISDIETRDIIQSRQRKQRCWSDCTDAQADLRLCCSHMA